MGERGVGGLTITEVARRLGVQGPSLYKYFPSLNAVYDALFARGLASEAAATREAVSAVPPGIARIRAGAVAFVRWAVDNPALAQLLHWRAVPGFEPEPETLAPSVQDMQQLRFEFREAVRRGEVDPRADSDEAVQMLTVVMSGLFTQQLANQPGAAYEQGRFTRLTDQALDMFFAHYQPDRRNPHATP